LTILGVLVLGAVFTFILVVFGHAVTSMFLGADYASGADLIPLLCAGATANALAAVLADLLVIRRQTFELAVSFVIACAVGLLVTLVGTATFGAQGAAFGRLVAGLVAVAMIVVNIRRQKASVL
jgi:O-antigen/teichoic acid export membrane protein